MVSVRVGHVLVKGVITQLRWTSRIWSQSATSSHICRVSPVFFCSQDLRGWKRQTEEEEEGREAARK
jgi:hypothetical protein